MAVFLKLPASKSLESIQQLASLLFPSIPGVGATVWNKYWVICGFYCLRLMKMKEPFGLGYCPALITEYTCFPASSRPHWVLFVGMSTGDGGPNAYWPFSAESSVSPCLLSPDACTGQFFVFQQVINLHHRRMGFSGKLHTALLHNAWNRPAIDHGHLERHYRRVLP